MSHVTEIDTMAYQLHDVDAFVIEIQIITNIFILFRIIYYHIISQK